MNKSIAIALVLALNTNAETFTYTSTVNTPIAIARAKAGLVRVDVSSSVTVKGVYTVVSSGGAYNANFTLSYSMPPFSRTDFFSAYQNWPVGSTVINGFSTTDNRTAYYTSGLTDWQYGKTMTCAASATNDSGTAAVDPTSPVTITVTYTYDSIPGATKPKKK
jgi:hypothetical protein